MTDQFIQSQIEYYRKHLGSGNSFDRGMICGLLHYYEGLQNERRRLSLPLA